MGNIISRIEREFIIKALDDNKFPVDVHGNKKEAEAVILNFENEEYIELFSKERDLDGFEANEPVRVFFSYYGHVMTFNSVIIKGNDEKLKITFPEKVLKNLQRKYERVDPPKDVHLSFLIDNIKFELDFPQSEQFRRLEDYTYTEKFDTSNINNLIEEFRSIISGHCDNNKITMFREKRPESYEEKLIAQTGKSFFVQSIYEGISVPETETDMELLDRDDLEPEVIEDIFSSMKKAGVYSALYTPILYHEYTAGYIYLSNTRNKKIAVDTLDYVSEFSKVLAWTLGKNGYFSDGKPVSEEFSSQIVDISASGLLFTDNSENLSDAVNLYSDIDMQLTIGPRKVIVSSRVMRKFHSRGRTFYGVQFMSISPEDFRYLFEYVYGRVFTENDNMLWEGGSKPPTLEL